MWSAIGSTLGAVLGWIWPLVVGIFGWYIANFLAKPFLDFRGLRSQINEEIMFTDNVGPMTAHDKESHNEASASLRRLGAKMKAMNEDAPLLRWALANFGYNLEIAGSSLIGLSNSLATPYEHRNAFVNRIQIALKLPRDNTVLIHGKHANGN